MMVPRVSSHLSDVFTFMHTPFGNRPLMRHEEQGHPSYFTYNAYDDQEASFKQTVKMVPLDEVAHQVNFMSSHTIGMVKVHDDAPLFLKARISTHGNEDYLRRELRSDCNMCSLVRMRIFLSAASLLH